MKLNLPWTQHEKKLILTRETRYILSLPIFKYLLKRCFMSLTPSHMELVKRAHSTHPSLNWSPTSTSMARATLLFHPRAYPTVLTLKEWTFNFHHSVKTMVIWCGRRGSTAFQTGSEPPDSPSFDPKLARANHNSLSLGGSVLPLSRSFNLQWVSYG